MRKGRPPVRQRIDSPCIDVCSIDPQTRLCVGCARSIDEIAQWGSMTPDERARVMRELPRREAAGKAGR